MKRFKNILFYADGISHDCPALQRAVALAKQNQARLTVVDVLEETEAWYTFKQLGHNPNRIFHTRRLAELEHLIAPYQGNKELLYVQLLHGKSFIEVIRMVLKSRIDLVIKQANQLQGLTGPMLSSNDQHLLRKCPCPVWIDRSENQPGYDSILAAVDPLAQPDPGTNQLVLDLATSLAARDNARLSVVHAWDLYGGTTTKSSWFNISTEEFEEALAACRQTHQQQLDQLLQPYRLDPASVHLVNNQAAAAIIDTAKSVAAELIVMGTVGRSGIPGLFIGNTAEEVLLTTQTSILAVKPVDFVSPVTLPDN